MTKQLRTLEAANADAFQRRQDGKPVPNGIACPKCGSELWDTRPNVTLTSYPAQKEVGCPNIECGYMGTRFV
jgi:hypothetical protein